MNFTIEQKEWLTKRITKIINTADMVKQNAPYVKGLAETIKRDIRKLKRYIMEIDRNEP